jgi:hypothetical protein
MINLWRQSFNLVSAFFFGFKAGYLQESFAGDGFEHLGIIAGLHVFDEVDR